MYAILSNVEIKKQDNNENHTDQIAEIGDLCVHKIVNLANNQKSTTDLHQPKGITANNYNTWKVVF